MLLIRSALAVLQRALSPVLKAELRALIRVWTLPDASLLCDISFEAVLQLREGIIRPGYDGSGGWFCLLSEGCVSWKEKQREMVRLSEVG